MTDSANIISLGNQSTVRHITVHTVHSRLIQLVFNLTNSGIYRYYITPTDINELINTLTAFIDTSKEVHTGYWVASVNSWIESKDVTVRLTIGTLRKVDVIQFTLFHQGGELSSVTFDLTMDELSALIKLLNQQLQ